VMKRAKRKCICFWCALLTKMRTGFVGVRDSIVLVDSCNAEERIVKAIDELQDFVSKMNKNTEIKVK
jgi:hypothetical protein